MDQALRDVCFHGLLHVAPDQRRPLNLGGRGDPLATYVACAVLCARSLAHAGYRFRLVTNDPAAIEQRRRAAGLPEIEVVEHAFVSTPPPGAAFYSAHFKLELIGALADGRYGDAVGLIDLDTVLLRPFDLPPPPDAGLIGYDITDQVVPGYGRDVIDRDLGLLLGADASQARWWGGEFIVGRPAGFAALDREVQRLWPTYLAHHRGFHHVGDEIVTTAALATLVAQGHAVTDAARAGGVVRWWSARTLSPQPPLDTVLDRSLLHLPADKAFLAAEAARPFEPAAFLRRYRAHVRRKLLVRGVVAPVRRMLGRRDSRLLPRLR